MECKRKIINPILSSNKSFAECISPFFFFRTHHASLSRDVYCILAQTYLIITLGHICYNQRCPLNNRLMPVLIDTEFAIYAIYDITWKYIPPMLFPFTSSVLFMPLEELRSSLPSDSCLVGRKITHKPNYLSIYLIKYWMIGTSICM